MVMCHLILFTTGRGSVVGPAISPVTKICVNPDTFERLHDDLDVNEGRILTQSASIEQVGTEIFETIESVASSNFSRSEELGHQEFILTYKQFEPSGPQCLPR